MQYLSGAFFVTRLLDTYAKEWYEVGFIEVIWIRYSKFGPNLFECAHFLTSDRSCATNELEYIRETLDDNTYNNPVSLLQNSNDIGPTSKHIDKDIL